MRIKNPKTSEIAYIENVFNLLDYEGNVVKNITLDELKNWQKYEDDINLSKEQKDFIKLCINNLLQCYLDNVTHIMKENNMLYFCKYENNKLVFIEEVQVKDINLKDRVVYSLKELKI